jgi:carboxypeptidase Taq
MMTAYEFLKERFAQLKNLGGAAQILSKDMETVMAPGSAADREQQLMAISSACHSLISDPRVEDWLNEAETRRSTLSQNDQRNLQLMRRDWIHQAGLPTDLVHEKSRIEAVGQNIHVSNYKSGDWNAVKEWYAHSFRIAREIGQVKKDKLGVSGIYDALLDEFSPGLRAAHVDQEFAALDKALRVMIPQAIELQKKRKDPLPFTGSFKLKSQMKLNKIIAKAVGFDFNRGVLQMIPGHPSSSGSSDDARITTRGAEHEFFESLYATIHEVGHAMYEQNQPLEWRYQPAGGHLGMAVHESQSMIMELQACMTEEFLQFLAPKLQRIFKRENDPAFTAENLRQTLWRTQPSFIRVNADELTYPMHILLRHDLESNIIAGKLDAKDLPEAWNSGLKQRLGIIPPDNAQGCMQDIHWPTGSIGYFPAYTLGAMGAAQFFAAAKASNESLLYALSKGNFKPLKSWLKKNVHSKGCLIDADTLFVKATGEKLNARAYMNHLNHRYLAGNDYNSI